MKSFESDINFAAFILEDGMSNPDKKYLKELIQDMNDDYLYKAYTENVINKKKLNSFNLDILELIKKELISRGVLTDKL